MTRTESINFYNSYKGLLFNTSLRILGNSMEAEEVTQDTILKYLQFAGEMVVQQERAWLVKTCVRASIDVLRKRNVKEAFLEEYGREENQELMEQTGEQMWGALRSENTSDLVERVKRGLKELPDGYRSVLSMVLFEGYDYEEIAQIMGVKEATVRSQYMRGKIKLAEIVKQNNI